MLVPILKNKLVFWLKNICSSNLIPSRIFKWLGDLLRDNILLFLNTIILTYIVETRSKFKKKISTKIPKHALARFRDVVSYTPQSGYFSKCILWAVTSKASIMHVIADKSFS